MIDWEAPLARGRSRRSPVSLRPNRSRGDANPLDRGRRRPGPDARGTRAVGCTAALCPSGSTIPSGGGRCRHTDGPCRPRRHRETVPDLSEDCRLGEGARDGLASAAGDEVRPPHVLEERDLPSRCPHPVSGHSLVSPPWKVTAAPEENSTAASPPAGLYSRFPPARGASDALRNRPGDLLVFSTKRLQLADRDAPPSQPEPVKSVFSDLPGAAAWRRGHGAMSERRPGHRAGRRTSPRLVAEVCLADRSRGWERWTTPREPSPGGDPHRWIPSWEPRGRAAEKPGELMVMRSAGPMRTGRRHMITRGLGAVGHGTVAELRPRAEKGRVLSGAALPEREGWTPAGSKSQTRGTMRRAGKDPAYVCKRWRRSWGTEIMTVRQRMSRSSAGGEGRCGPEDVEFLAGSAASTGYSRDGVAGGGSTSPRASLRARAPEQADRWVMTRRCGARGLLAQVFDGRPPCRHLFIGQLVLRGPSPGRLRGGERLSSKASAAAEEEAGGGTHDRDLKWTPGWWA